jgi:hypothetical protein
MLSAEERRRLDEIERLLQLNDPDFVARMRGGHQRRRWAPVAVQILLWWMVGVLGLAAGWQVGVVAAATVGVVVLVVAVYRRGRRRGQGWSTPDTPHFYW